eukprot:356802-Chlamydomonas_euryale.AAC.2
MHILNSARLTHGHVARMPDGSVIKQLLFAEGLRELGLSGVVGRLCSTWQDRAFAALSPVLTSRLAGWGWYGAVQDCARWRALGYSTQPAV